MQYKVKPISGREIVENVQFTFNLEKNITSYYDVVYNNEKINTVSYSSFMPENIKYDDDTDWNAIEEYINSNIYNGSIVSYNRGYLVLILPLPN